MALRPAKAVCHVCHGDDITVNGKGVLVRHRERIVTSGGQIANGEKWCDGGGLEPEPVEPIDLSSERFPSASVLERERWAA